MHIYASNKPTLFGDPWNSGLDLELVFLGERQGPLAHRLGKNKMSCHNERSTGSSKYMPNVRMIRFLTWTVFLDVERSTGNSKYHRNFRMTRFSEFEHFRNKTHRQNRVIIKKDYPCSMTSFLRARDSLKIKEECRLFGDTVKKIHSP